MWLVLSIYKKRQSVRRIKKKAGRVLLKRKGGKKKKEALWPEIKKKTRLGRKLD